MGKHNGKARKMGITVGSALVNRAKREGRAGTASAYLHTTEPVDKGPNMQSVIESNDLDEMMEMVRAGAWGPGLLVATERRGVPPSLPPRHTHLACRPSSLVLTPRHL